LTNGCVQLLLLWTLKNGSTYLDLLYLATSLILLPYLWSAGYQVLLAVRGETYAGGGRTKDLAVGLLATVYAVWLVYAGGWQYVLIAALFYLVGTAFYVWARTESKQRMFTRAEWVAVAVVVVTSVVAVIGWTGGWLEV
jgi:arginine:ornithine antiporter/lysine permease